MFVVFQQKRMEVCDYVDVFGSDHSGEEEKDGLEMLLDAVMEEVAGGGCSLCRELSLEPMENMPLSSSGGGGGGGAIGRSFFWCRDCRLQYSSFRHCNTSSFSSSSKRKVRRYL